MYQEASQMFSFPFARQKEKYKIALSPSFRADWGTKKKKKKNISEGSDPAAKFLPSLYSYDDF